MTDLKQLGEQAISAKYKVQNLSTEEKNKALAKVADALEASTEAILQANAKDVKTGEENGMHPGMIDRLRLTRERVADMAQGLRQISLLEDPIGELLEEMNRPNGLHIEKKRVPIGVIGIIYESRPNVTVDAFGLCFKTGNAVILKGGSDAIHSNIAIANCIREALVSENVVRDVIQMIEDTSRDITNEFMKMNHYIDVLIPRGGAGLIHAVVENSTIPVIETGTGNCHVYVDEFADFQMAIAIILNAKTQRIGVCNACESLVVHNKIASTFLPLLTSALKVANVEIRGDQTACQYIEDCIPATEEDFSKEYLDYIISVKTVNSIKEAIAHINQNSTKHSDVIITEEKAKGEQFLNEVDAACVYVNASSRFSDGFEFGFGAEIGISTQKIHARGPMGLKELTSYKYRITGNGQTR